MMLTLGEGDSEVQSGLIAETIFNPSNIWNMNQYIYGHDSDSDLLGTVISGSGLATGGYKIPPGMS